MKEDLKKNQRIIWLASYPKSGNTWLRAFLTSYCSQEEELDLDKIMPFSDADYLNYQNVSPIPINELSCYDLVLIKSAAMFSLVTQHPGQVLLVKTHDINLDIRGQPLISAILSLGGIYVIRDPRDIVCSLSSHLVPSLSFPELVNKLLHVEYSLGRLDEYKFHHFLCSWNKHVDSWTKSKFPVILIRYEDMLSEPESTFKNVINFLQLKYDEESYKRAMKNTSFSNMQMLEERDGFKEKRSDNPFFRKGKAGSWKTELSKHLVYKIEEQCHEIMTRFDYELSRPFGGKYPYEETEEIIRKHEHR